LVSRIDAAAVREGLRRGVDRLVAVAGEHGWRNFRTLAGESGVWVSAFVVARVVPVAARRAAVRRARLAIARAQHPAGGWSFGGAVPPDADSTAWALQALEGTRLLDPAGRRRAGAFLEGHCTGDGYATYAPDGAIAAFIGARDRSVDGWTAEHPDVTAAVLMAGPPGITNAAALSRLVALVARQTGAGWWPAYWWRSSQYTGALLVRALARRGRCLPPARERLLVEALAREQLPNGGYPLGGAHESDPFSTALAVDTLSLLTVGEARELRARAVGALLATQLGDGGWVGDYQLRIPPPDAHTPQHVSRWQRGGGGGGSLVLDRDGVFATAQACAALASCLAPAAPLIPLPEPPRRLEQDVVEVFATRTS
jgi:hypothetical protein